MALYIHPQSNPDQSTLSQYKDNRTNLICSFTHSTINFLGLLLNLRNWLYRITLKKLSFFIKTTRQTTLKQHYSTAQYCILKLILFCWDGRRRPLTIQLSTARSQQPHTTFQQPPRRRQPFASSLSHWTPHRPQRWHTPSPSRCLAWAQTLVQSPLHRSKHPK